jgi:hypothetical protein
MEDSERVLAIIEGLSSDNSIDNYNLVLTTRRIALMRTPYPIVNPQVGLAKGGLVGWALGSLIEKGVESEMNEKENSQSLTLDDLLQKDEKSYAISYEEITEIKLHKGLINSKLIVESKDSQKVFSFNKNFKKIHTMLLQTPELAGKVSLSS